MNEFLETNRSYVIKFLIFIATYFVFRQTIIEFLISISSIINFESVSFKIGLILFCLVIFILYTSKFDNKFKFSWQYTLTGVLLLVIYFLERFFFDSISFLPHGTYIKYVDFILMFTAVHILVLNRYKKRDVESKSLKGSKEEECFFIEDRVYDGEIDNELILKNLLGRLNGFMPDSSFSIGVNASWGYGKSTFLNRFYYKYKQENKEGIIFWYNIWRNKDSEAIIDNFFSELSNNLSPYSGEISNEVDKYVNAILHITPNGIGKAIEAGKSIFVEESSLEVRFNRIKNAIKKIDRQIVILLDDLDRLEKNEILATYKLIRTLSNFNNVIFISGYDVNYLELILGTEKKYFSDKIFQTIINLLPHEPLKINDKLFKYLEVNFPKHDAYDDKNESIRISFSNLSHILKDESESIPSCIEKLNIGFERISFNSFLRTDRDIKRFINEIKFILVNKGLIENINIPEYLLLKLLSFKYRFIDAEFIIKLENVLDDFGGNINDVGVNPMHLSDDKFKILKDDQIEKLRCFLCAKNFKNEDIYVILASLWILFKERDEEYYRNNRTSITNHFMLPFYLRNGIVSGHYTLSDFKKVIEKGKLVLLTKELSLIEDKQVSTKALIELRELLRKINVSKKEILEDILNAANEGLFSNYNPDQNQLMIDILDRANNNIFDGKESDFINYIKEYTLRFETTFVDLLLSDLNLNLKRQESNFYKKNEYIEYKNYQVFKPYIKDILISKLKRNIKKGSYISISRSYHSLIERIILNYKVLKPIEVNKILREDIEKRSYFYLDNGMFDFNEESGNEAPSDYAKYVTSIWLPHIFSNEKELQKSLDNPKNKEIYENFIIMGWQNYYEFLLHIDISTYNNKQKERLEQNKKLFEKFKKKGYNSLDYREY
ncbi:P-loop NTPase fold protein [Joostella atrarenae]|uniref:P-loop NTPase fold protein n=1 Tax=Joostella atrarenae TaxID=679257 RepID=UPI001F353964|nr:P-loop NTPase fold protein [Joostella atrarenae]